MSDLWLDTELSDERLAEIAAVVQQSGLSHAELEDVFTLELAPFLGANLWATAGEWAGFDPTWVCAQARARKGNYRFRHRVLAALGLTTYGARPAWNRVKQIAFKKAD